MTRFTLLCLILHCLTLYCLALYLPFRCFVSFCTPWLVLLALSNLIIALTFMSIFFLLFSWLILHFSGLLYFVISWLISVPCFALSCHFLSWLVSRYHAFLPYLTRPRLALFCLTSHCLVISCLVLSCLVLSCFDLSCFILSCFDLARLVLPSLTLPYISFDLP